MTNILIGVGGTGAKIVEAAMILVAAGLGPKQLHVGLVDQDNANGNVARTKTLITNYRELRAKWGAGSPDNRLDWSGNVEAGRPDGLALCRSDVNPLFGDSVSWCPGGDQASLRSIIGQNLSERQKDLFDLLFMPGPEEQDLQLGEGYRGRAHVGAAALISRLTDPNNPLTSKVGELMAGGGGREQVNIFVAGSAFGGTGAAGFPTIARELNRIRNGQDFTNKGKVAIGGALMLPYFGFAPPEQADRNRVVTTDELLPKAQLALEHYGNLFDSGEHPFERFHLVGWDRFFQLGYHEAGNAEQCNPPLLPELFAAAAALSFFGSGEDALIKALPAELVRISARAGRHVQWQDFPLPGIQSRLGQLFRFAVYWRYTVAGLVEEKRRFLSKGNWTHQLTQKANREDALEALQSLDALIDKILAFGAAIEVSAPNDWDIGPWRLGRLHDSQQPRTPTNPVTLLRPGNLPDATEVFSQLIRQDKGKPMNRDAAAVFDELENRGGELAAGKHRGYARVVAAAYEAARLS